MTEAARTDWKEIATKAKSRLANIYEENRETIRFGVDTIEVWGAAGFMGWIHGANGGIPKRFGIPLDIAATAVLKLFAFGGWLGKSYSADLHALGNGFGAYWIGTMGLDLGQKRLAAQKEADKKPAGHPLTESEAKTANLDTRTNTIIGAGAQQAAQMGRGRMVPRNETTEIRVWR